VSFAEGLRAMDGVVCKLHVERAIEMFTVRSVEFTPELNCFVGGQMARVVSMVKDEPDPLIH
jgi:hypothetical protein